MPRLPTILVIGSQFISTRFRPLVVASRWGAVTVDMIYLLEELSAAPVRLGAVAGGQLRALVPPARLLVDGVVGHRPQVADNLPVHADEHAGHAGAGGLVHEGHELVGEAGHRAGDAD